MTIDFNLYKDYKPIPDYEHYIINRNGHIINTKTGTYLKQSLNTHGYLRVGLCKDSKSKTVCVHRLVAKVFVPNPNNYDVVNHKDENKINNNADNLEWCTTKYNHNYGNALIKNGKAHRKPIIAINANVKIIADSYKTFSEYVGVKSPLRSFINGKYRCKGYHLFYASKEEIDLLGDNELISIDR